MCELVLIVCLIVLIAALGKLARYIPKWYSLRRKKKTIDRVNAWHRGRRKVSSVLVESDTGCDIEIYLKFACMRWHIPLYGDHVSPLTLRKMHKVNITRYTTSQFHYDVRYELFDCLDNLVTKGRVMRITRSVNRVGEDLLQDIMTSLGNN